MRRICKGRCQESTSLARVPMCNRPALKPKGAISERGKGVKSLKLKAQKTIPTVVGRAR